MRADRLMKKTGLAAWMTVLALGLATGKVGAQEKTETPAPAAKKVVIIPVVGEINYSQNAFVIRAIDIAKKSGAELIIVDIDSPGGAGDAIQQHPAGERPRFE